METVLPALNKLLNSPDENHGKAVSEAILTTDLVSKSVWVEQKLEKRILLLQVLQKVVE